MQKQKPKILSILLRIGVSLILAGIIFITINSLI